MWNIKPKLIPVIISATGTISKSIRQYLSSIQGKQKIKELQNNSHTGHCTQTAESANVKVQNIFHGRSNITYLLTYLLPPWSRVLLEKLTGSAASQEIPRNFGTRRFITVLTIARHLSLSSANSIQSSQPPPTS